MRARDAEALLRGATPGEEAFAEAAERAKADLDPSSDTHASAAYRRRIAGVLARAGAAGGERVSVEVSLTVNGVARSATVEPRRTLADFLREELELTGTHLGCEHGVCGACTVLVDGVSARSCLMLAVQADGAEVTTIEGLLDGGEFGVLQQACRDSHAFQCGFCTPGLPDDGDRAARREPDARASTRCARRSPATSAAAPATRASSQAILLAAERGA